MRADVSLHRSLLMKLLAASVVIALCSVTATAWLASRTTATAIRHDQGQALSDATDIYDTLVGYAAAHRDWNGVRQTVRDLAGRTGRHITLTTQDRSRTLARSGPATALPRRASAVIDPLHVDPSLATGTATSTATGTARIDSRAVGPYRLTSGERRVLDQKAKKSLTCLNANGFTAHIAHRPNERPSLAINGSATLVEKASQSCAIHRLDQPTPTEDKALRKLRELAADCLTRHGQKHTNIGLDFVVLSGSAPAQACVDAARQEQLAPYVAPAAQLFVDSPSTAGSGSAFAVSPANTVRIAGIAGLVLTLTVAVTALVGRRLVRPLRALTSAAQSSPDTHVRVPVTTRGEIGYLAAAFNDLSARRERIEEQRKSMVSDIAHELRTPLSNIRIWLEAVQDGIAEPDHVLASSLLEEAHQLQHIIDDLQDLAAADAGALRLHAEPVYVRDLLDQVASSHRAQEDMAGIHLTVRTDGDPVLGADPVRLRQAVTNLVSNAVRHSPPGGTVTLSASQPPGEVVIEVSDTGTGISPEDLPHVFDRFWRAEKSRSRRTGGTGLGLAIVRQLTHAHGGTVEVRSTLGAGTVFTLRLPVMSRHLLETPR
ncbi:sensor histidine kinase [Streptomyces sp. NPDC048282]|uniref:sensor histidine kinase n=1 Tax=Streptomyces sp. NPDC048282 TaxID=3365528 RepID=UPI00371198CA